MPKTVPVGHCSKEIPWCWARVIDYDAECICPVLEGHKAPGKRPCNCDDCCAMRAAREA